MEKGRKSKEKSERERKDRKDIAFANFVTPAAVLVHSPRVPAVPLLFQVSSFFFLLVAQVLRAFAFLRLLRSFFVRRSLAPSLSLTLECDAFARSSFGPRLLHNCIPVSALSHRRTSSPSLFLALPLFLFLPLRASRSRSLQPLYSRSFSPTRTQYYIPLGPASPTLPPLPYLDTVRARSPPATLEWERRVRSSRTCSGCHVSVDENKRTSHAAVSRRVSRVCVYIRACTSRDAQFGGRLRSRPPHSL